jgi:general secretion pathway protein D
MSFGQSVEHISKQEIARRQAALPRGEEALARGKEAMKQKNYAVAHEEFRVAVNYLPDAVVSGKAHDEAVDGFCDSGIKLAEQRIAEGKYAEADFFLSEILNDRYNPKCREASELLVKLRTPGYFNRTVGPKFLAKVEDVKKLLV